MIYNSIDILNLDLDSTYLKRLENDNYIFSMKEISKLSKRRLESVELPLVLRKVRTLIDGLGDYLDIREDDYVSLDPNMMDCVEVRFSARSDIKVNLYIENRNTLVKEIVEPDFDEDEMYFTYKRNNRRVIMHGSMVKMIEELKAVLNGA